MFLITVPYKYVTNYSPLKIPKVHNLFLDIYQQLISTSTDKKLSYIDILNEEMGKCFLEDFRLYIKSKFPKHELNSIIPQTGCRYYLSELYDRAGVCLYNSENVYNVLLKVYENYCKTEDDLQFLTDLIRTKLGTGHASGFSDFLCQSVRDHPLIPYLN